jgi:hypothetical protein
MKKTFWIMGLSLFLTAGFFISSAKAEPKFYQLFWWPGHWENQDFKPYYENGTDPHPLSYRLDPRMATWSPAQWVRNDQNTRTDKPGLGLIARWYDARILVDQYMDDDVPYLSVGPNFYHLSGFDKSRVAQTIDHVYGITKQKPGMFYIIDARTEEVIGFYTKDQLILH